MDRFRAYFSVYTCRERGWQDTHYGARRLETLEECNLETPCNSESIVQGLEVLGLFNTDHFWQV